MNIYIQSEPVWRIVHLMLESGNVIFIQFIDANMVSFCVYVLKKSCFCVLEPVPPFAFITSFTANFLRFPSTQIWDLLIYL